MDKEIIKQLGVISNQFKIKILYACESGSRAWGFPSADSDYDVRFIYTRPLSWYLSIESKPDSIVLPINDELDVNGWDIKKALSLMHKYNASLAEWLMSPMVYFQEQHLTQKLQSLSEKSFIPMKGRYHYSAQAKKFHSERESEYYSLKSFCYFLRSTLCILWIDKFETQPPVNIMELVEPLELGVKFVEPLKNLIEYKYDCYEKDKVPKQFMNFVESGYQLYSRTQAQSPELAKSNHINLNEYDRLFFLAATNG